MAAVRAIKGEDCSGVGFMKSSTEGGICEVDEAFVRDSSLMVRHQAIDTNC